MVGREKVKECLSYDYETFKSEIQINYKFQL